jgi:coenzyme A diphosphatase NUDT7
VLSEFKSIGSNALKYSTISSKPIDLAFLKETLSKFSRKNYFDHVASKNENIKKWSRASVLVPISIQKETGLNGIIDYRMSYTMSKRTMEMKTFRGQVCFVGGRRDATDADDVATAYREAEEEIGIRPESLTFLAEMCPIVTTTGIIITPIVAYFDKTNFEPKLNRHEVEIIFDLPTERFLSNKDHTFKSIKGADKEWYMHEFMNQVEGRPMNVIGVTAFICIFLSAALHKRNPEFTVDPELPLEFERDTFLPDYLLVKSGILIDFLSDKDNNIDEYL